MEPFEVDNYREIREQCSRWISGKTKSLLIFGDAANGKSSRFEYDKLPSEDFTTIKGQLTAAKLYRKLYNDRGGLFILDDCRKILKDDACVTLLMQLCEKETVKTIHWETERNKDVEDEDEEEILKGLPSSFETTSRVCIILNDVNLESAQLEPILTRVLIVHFCPPVHAIHEYVGSWFPQKGAAAKDIYNFTGKHLDIIPQYVIRQIMTALELYDAKESDWKQYLLNCWNKNKFQTEFLRLRSDKAFQNKPDNAVFAEFHKRCGGSRPTWFRLKREFPERIGYKA